jgi:hypothetical protein
VGIAVKPCHSMGMSSFSIHKHVGAKRFAK